MGGAIIDSVESFEPRSDGDEATDPAVNREPHMTPRSKSLRVAARLLIGALALCLAGVAEAEDKLVVLTTWFAQAEHGGLYQAAATGIYKKYGLDVTVKSGGPQVNGIQLLLAGQADFIMNYDFAV